MNTVYIFYPSTIDPNANIICNSEIGKFNMAYDEFKKLGYEIVLSSDDITDEVLEEYSHIDCKMINSNELFFNVKIDGIVQRYTFIVYNNETVYSSCNPINVGRNVNELLRLCEAINKGKDVLTLCEG